MDVIDAIPPKAQVLLNWTKSCIEKQITLQKLPIWRGAPRGHFTRMSSIPSALKLRDTCFTILSSRREAGRVIWCLTTVTWFSLSRSREGSLFFSHQFQAHAGISSCILWAFISCKQYLCERRDGGDGKMIIWRKKFV